jgi:ketosteroid isomerase-like protein
MRLRPESPCAPDVGRCPRMSADVGTRPRPVPNRVPPLERDTAGAMSEENVEAFKHLLEAGDRHDFEAILEALNPAVEWHHEAEMLGLLDPNLEIIPAKEFPGPARPVYHGHEGFLEFLGEWFTPWDEYSIELEELIDAGDRVITVEHHVGRSSETGLEIAQRVSDIWTIKSGGLAECRVFMDEREALEAAGLEE